jgi:hypothetical protein
MVLWVAVHPGEIEVLSCVSIPYTNALKLGSPPPSIWLLQKTWQQLARYRCVTRRSLGLMPSEKPSTVSLWPSYTSESV